MSFNYNPIYRDTDSVNDVYNMKQYLNQIYGTQMQEGYMNRDYISVIVDGNPTIIFKRNVIAVTKENKQTAITCVNDYTYYTLEDYASVVKKIIN